MGYFDPRSDLNPLLHTWSLSVEEQIYLVMPMLIVLVWKQFDWKVSRRPSFIFFWDGFDDVVLRVSVDYL